MKRRTALQASIGVVATLTLAACGGGQSDNGNGGSAAR